MEEAQKTNKTLQQEITEFEEVIRVSITQRKSLFGDADPNEFQQAIQQKSQDAESLLEQITQRFNQLQLQLQTNATEEKESQNLIKKYQTESEQLREQLEQSIHKIGFEDLTQLQSAILSGEQSEHLQILKESFDKRSLQLKQDIKTNAQDLEKVQQQALTDEPLEALHERHKELDSNYQTLQQRIGAINEQLDQNERRKSESKQLVDRIENQRKEYNRWAKLNDIIGQADGKKFRVFAQGLTLKKLSLLANQHLQLLNSRYIIHKRSDEDLTLDIIDTYQADNVRSMNTLSGGESFLVSLSLALGLSDLAGRNANINSLFIDEGFGTLDEATLDLAISTLENLQSSGKTIGVISHVKALKERISTQIVIQKSGSGFSSLDIVS
jgi:exonuclease SbcC